jgi:cytochrome P450
VAKDSSSFLNERVPGYRRIKRLPRQLMRRTPFTGSILPGRVPLFRLGSGRPSLPFPHPWNYHEPLQILETFFCNAHTDNAAARHTRYLEVPGFAPVMVTRDPLVIRAISSATGDRPGMFDRDTLPSTGIARATGEDTLLYANGAKWKRQKKLSTPPFARTTLFQPEKFNEFEKTFRCTIEKRLAAVSQRINEDGEPLRVKLEPEIKAIMLEMLVNNFFGADIEYEEIKDRYVPALDCVIDHIVRDTVVNTFGIPLGRVPGFTSGLKRAKQASIDFDQLTDICIAQRSEGRGLWKQFQSEATNETLRGNIKVFLAGALEATTSYASWAISHLARSAEAQDRVFQDVRDIYSYTPEALARAEYLGHVLNETLRLTPSLYFHPRRATADTVVETAEGDTLRIPLGTHILMDVWHANRNEELWGVDATGFPALEFAPERWSKQSKEKHNSHHYLHFGFGHGPRFCPGKSLGQLEVALVVGACVKLFRFEAVNAKNNARAGVSTKPRDGVLVDLSLRKQTKQDSSMDSDSSVGSSEKPIQAPSNTVQQRCPFANGPPPGNEPTKE